MFNYFLGVDVSKSTLDLALIKDGELLLEEQIANKVSAIRTFFKQLVEKANIPIDQLMVCMEHTGIYNYQILQVLVGKKICVCVEPALQIKQSQGMVRGKNDRVDAVRIAQYAYKNRAQLRIWKPQRLALQTLKALLGQRERLINVKVQLQIPLQEAVGFVDPSIVKSLRQSTTLTMKAIEKNIQFVEGEIDKLIEKDQLIATHLQRASSVPGIGKITALNIILSTNNFERITDPKKFACYCGVAPFEHSSGSSIRGKTRVSRLANMTMKKLLHLAAMAAISSKGEIREYYQRKVTEGKNKMSVINAVRNKLITRVFVCVNQNRSYEKMYQPTLA